MTSGLMTSGMVRVDWEPQKVLSEERRESPRASVSLFVLHSGQTSEAAFGTLGLRGCLFWTNEGFERDQVLTLRLLLPNKQRAVDVSGRVVQSRSPSSDSRRLDTLVVFEDLPFHAQREIARWLDVNSPAR